MDYITLTEGTDEYGEPVFNWFCDHCGEGGSTYDPQTTEQEAEDHRAEKRIKAEEN